MKTLILTAVSGVVVASQSAFAGNGGIMIPARGGH